jgi:methionine-rich copper-binding protein CopC
MVVMTGPVAALLALAAFTAPLGAADPAVPTITTLLRATPDVGAVVTSPPATVTLTFDQILSSGSVTVTGPAGAADTGNTTVGGGALTDPLLGHLPNGTYTVSWRAKPQRGRPTTGSYTFGIAVASTSPATSPAGPTTPTPPLSSGQPVVVPSSGTSSTPPTATVVTATGTGTGTGSGTGSGSSADTAAAANGSRGSADQTGGSTQHPLGAAPGTTTHTTRTTPVEEDTGTPTAVKAIAADSRALGPWLIAIAVLIQAAAGLYGLWRWRRAERTAEPDQAPGGPKTDAEALDEGEAWADDLAMQRMLAERRPWTGELPVQGARRN